MVLCKHGYNDHELVEDEYYLDDIEQDTDWRRKISDTEGESEDDDSEEDDSDESSS